MTVTEIAILTLVAGDVDPPLVDELKRSLDIQNDWHIAHFPHLPSTLEGRASHCLQEIEDRSKIIITAKWESLEAHWKWIRSEENAKVMAALSTHVTADPDDMVLLHVDSVLFGKETLESTSLLDSPIIAVERLFISPSEQDRLEGLEIAKDLTTKAAAPHPVRGGWRVDVESDDRLEYVLVSGWDSVERHQAFEVFAGSRLKEAKQVARKVNSKHYERIL